MLDHFFPLLFPKDSESLKILDIRLRKVGAKRPLNGTSKVNRQTHRRSDKHTDRWTFWLIESIGPEGRCFEMMKNTGHIKMHPGWYWYIMVDHGWSWLILVEQDQDAKRVSDGQGRSFGSWTWQKSYQLKQNGCKRYKK